MREPRHSYCLLGAPHVLEHLTGAALGFPAKGFELAAWLFLEHGTAPARREQAALVLWGDAERERASTTLRALLTRLRRIGRETGFEPIAATRGHLRLLVPPADLERKRFLASSISAAALLERCELYRGDLLDIPGTGEWVAGSRATIRTAFARAAAAFLERADPASEAAAIEVTATKLLAIDPYLDAPYRALMRCHAAAGRLRELENLYRECCERFETELGRPPEASVKALYRSLCGLDRAAATTVHAAARPAPRATPSEDRNWPPQGGMPRLCILPPTAAPKGQESDLVAALLEDVTIGVCARRDFAVIAPHTAWHLDADGAPESFVDAYGISYLLLSCVREIGGERFLVPKLIDARSRQIVWADRFVLAPDTLGRVYQRLVWRIVRSLSAAIEDAELGRYRRGVADSSAYVEYLLGTRALAKVQLPNVRAARHLFRASLRHDETFAPAFGGLARTLVTEWLLLARGDPSLLDEAEAYARRARALDPDRADGLHELGLCRLYRGDFDESLKAFADAEDRAPQHADLIADHADALSLSGSPSDALGKIQRAVALNPLCPDRYRWYEGTILYQLEQYEPAIRAVSRMADTSAASKLLAASWAMLGDRTEARLYARKVLETYPDFTVDKWLAVIPIRDPAVRERYERGLRAAGLS